MHLGPDTRGLNLDTHARRTVGAPSQYSEHSQALHLGSRFTQFDSEATALGFANDENAHIGSWFTKPTMSGMETRLAGLDGTEECIGAASGIAVTADGRSGSQQLIQSKPMPVLTSAQLKSMNPLPFNAWGGAQRHSNGGYAHRDSTTRSGTGPGAMAPESTLFGVCQLSRVEVPPTESTGQAPAMEHV
jgi:hypothetical protein